MARADLSAMLNRLPDDETPAPEPSTEAAAPEPPVAETPPNQKRTRRPAAPAHMASTTPAGYLSFERKESRLRADQYARLTEESRRLNRARATRGERITENTLIRIGIDLLLEQANKLAGDTEAELRKSVGL